MVVMEMDRVLSLALQVDNVRVFTVVSGSPGHGRSTLADQLIASLGITAHSPDQGFVECDINNRDVLRVECNHLAPLLLTKPLLKDYSPSIELLKTTDVDNFATSSDADDGKDEETASVRHGLTKLDN